MSRTRAIVLGLLCAAIAWAAYEMWRTDPSSRTFAMAAMLFFGMVALVSAMQLFPARLPEANVDGSISLYSVPLRAFLYALCAGAGAGAAWLLAFDDSTQGHRIITAILVTACAVCAGIALYFLARAFNGEPVYRLDREGISSPSMRQWRLRWRDIRRIESFEIQYVERLYLQPTPEARHALNWLERVYGMGVMGVVIGPGPTGLPLRELERLVHDYWQRHRS